MHSDVSSCLKTVVTKIPFTHPPKRMWLVKCLTTGGLLFCTWQRDCLASAITVRKALISAPAACLASTTQTRGAIISSEPNDVCSDVMSDALSTSSISPRPLRLSDVTGARSAWVPISRMRGAHSCVPAKPVSIQTDTVSYRSMLCSKNDSRVVARRARDVVIFDCQSQAYAASYYCRFFCWKQPPRPTSGEI